MRNVVKFHLTSSLIQGGVFDGLCSPNRWGICVTANIVGHLTIFVVVVVVVKKVK